ncbi:MAG: ADP-ribose pyrophosphatase [Phycisphaerae bacterium]|nr:ADP-ribose pyrophosphatase [Phycisphaerae bacterium]
MKPQQTDLLLQSRKYRVERWSFRNTPMGDFAHDLIIHPGAVIILPLLNERDVVMIHNLRPAVGTELLELPAGTLEPGEDPAVCAARELEEETGYTAGSITRLGQFYTSPGMCTEIMHCFLARELRPTTQKLDDTEQIRTEIMTLQRLDHLITRNQLVDGKTIAILAMYRLQQGGC